ncbi:unnamed protein product [Phytophthora lilii]|uniref:Unnamed protein product n=1 Tax=Phytophthora lilii TaxID=2077276 RepID=A0A9W6U0I2_9STRA|nr:unnamed protein product [Phytophthora lilii]
MPAFAGMFNTMRKSDGNIDYHETAAFMHFPFDLETVKALFEKGITLPHRQIEQKTSNLSRFWDRAVAIKFRLVGSRQNGDTASIVAHLAGRQYIEDKRVVAGWKKPHGRLAGVRMEEIGWGIAYTGTIMKKYSRITPLHLSAAQSKLDAFSELNCQAGQEDDAAITAIASKLLKQQL